MKKYAALVAAMLLSGTIVASAQDVAAPAATAPAASMPAPSMMAAMTPRGLIQEVDTAAKTFKIGGVGPATVVSYTDETIFYLSKAEAQVEMADGAKVLVIGRVSPDKTSIRAMSVNVYQIEEGDKAPEDEISFGNVTGTLKKDGEKLSLVVVTDEGEKVLEMNPVDADRVMAVVKVAPEEALQQNNLALLKGEKTEAGFAATAVQVMPFRRRVAPATAPATAPAEAPGASVEAAPAAE